MEIIVEDAFNLHSVLGTNLKPIQIGFQIVVFL